MKNISINGPGIRGPKETPDRLPFERPAIKPDTPREPFPETPQKPRRPTIHPDRSQPEPERTPPVDPQKPRE